MALLTVQNLSVRFTLGSQSFFAGERASFALDEGRTLALVGESGCGKTSIALALLRLPPPAAKIEADAISLRGRELTGLTERDMRAVRGKDMAMVFQDALTALNPVYTVGEQIAEALRLHERLGRRAAWERAVEAMREVGIPDPGRRAKEYPHQLSGGLRQRVTIAQAIACRPPLLIADEPTTALDVSLQAQIIDLLLKLQSDLRLSILLITHDLGVVAEMAHEVAVMYAGQIVEHTDAKSLFVRPLHPYTRGLLRSVPGAAPLTLPSPPGGEDARYVPSPLGGEGRVRGVEDRRLYSLEGTVPDLAHLPSGCRFAPRCPYAIEPCKAPQELREAEPGRLVRCCRALETLP